MKKKKTTEFIMFEFQGGPKDGLIIDVNLKGQIDDKFQFCETAISGHTFLSVYRLDLITKKGHFLKTSKLK